MSTFSAQCPNCSSLCDVPSIYVGKEVTCPTCRKTYEAEPYIEIQEPSEPVESQSKPEEKPAKVKEDSTGLWKYSIRVAEEQPVIVFFLRWAALIALFSFFQLLYQDWFTEDLEDMPRIAIRGLMEDRLITFGIIFGAIQLVKYLHAIAWNCQEVRKAGAQPEA